ncbi:MAG: hypothetical protein EOP61_30790 [Sphingomonadales bacterium]|nr:MAG: hypothetical protein EOP61_30790 [Sphingomonadales bacterium]
MKNITKMFAAIGLAIAALGASAPAQADRWDDRRWEDRRGGHDGRWGNHRRGYHESRWDRDRHDRRWDRDRRWKKHHRVRCWNEWRYGDRVRVCR